MKQYTEQQLNGHILNINIQNQVRNGKISFADGKLASYVYGMHIRNTDNFAKSTPLGMCNGVRSSNDPSIFTEEELQEIENIADEISRLSKRMNQITKKAFTQ